MAWTSAIDGVLTNAGTVRQAYLGNFDKQRK